MTLKERMEQMKLVKAELPALLEIAVENATLRAIEKAVEMTPPLADDEDDLRGTHTRTVGMKQRWKKDSKISPSWEGVKLVTVLENRAGETKGSKNDTSYASYVDEGHRVDRHFVPGLYIDKKSGLLSYDPKMAADQSGGLVVGTKTSYVKGIHMVDAAKEEYQKVLREQLKRLEELLQ